MKAALVSLHDPFDFRFGAFVREHNYERNKTLSYKELSRTETPYEPVACMLNLEMDRRNQEKVIIIIYNSKNNLILETLRSAVCAHQFNVTRLPIFATKDSQVVACGGHVCFHSST